MPRPSRRLRIAAGPLLVAVALLSSAACSAESPSASSSPDGVGARAGDLVVYSGRNENLVAPLLEQFTEASGIQVSTRYGGSAELAAQLLEEGGRTPASVFLSQDAGALGALQDAGRLAPLDPASLDRVPARYRSPEGRWVGVSGRSRVLVYNRDLVPEAELPASVFDLVDPRFAGKVAYAPTNGSFQAFVTGMRVAAGEERTRAFLTGLKANGAKAYENNVAIVDAVDRGEVPLGLVNHYYLYEKADEVGGLDRLSARNYLFPGTDPGSLVNVAGVGVLDGRQDERTRAFVEFLLSVPAQTYFAEQTKEFPLVAGVEPDVAGLPPLASLKGPEVDLSQLDTLEETLRLLDEVGLT